MHRALPSPAKPLLERLRADFPRFHFTLGTSDHWDSHDTVYYTLETPDCALLHELAHALLGHASYRLDIDLLRLERAAWDYARHVLAPRYDLTLSRDDAEDSLDTYRDWLHNRSLCPDCHLSGLQSSDGDYRCVACGLAWHANAAKTCALRRFKRPVGLPN